MPDVIHELYTRHGYPPMSHPLSDPAVSAVAARLAGLDVAHPRRARVLEIGCSSGHNLLPLARRWPESRFTGIDLAERAVEEARGLAAACEISNTDFHAADLTSFEPEDGPFDFIIAHGFLSWVPDPVKAVLFAFCRKHLAPNGIATVSFNLESGWKKRAPVIAKVRAIHQATGADWVSALEVLKTVVDPADPEIPVIDDMLAKGGAILAFDDFGPVNDPWSLGRLINAAAANGLRWLGESDPAENLPAGLGEGTIARLKQVNPDPLAFQLALDEASGRTFRSGLLCRADAPLAALQADTLLDFAARAGDEPAAPAARELHRKLAARGPSCVPLREIDGADGRLVWEGITRGWLRPRIEPVMFDPAPPAFPALDRLRLACARQGLPVVDIWHRPCGFPAAHAEVIAKMDGTRSCGELKEFAVKHAPELVFDPWLAHLAGRGFFQI